MSTIGLFDDIQTETAKSASSENSQNSENSTGTVDTAPDGTETSTTETNNNTPEAQATETAEVTVAEVPDGAISVSQFAELLTKLETQTPDGEVVRFPYGFVLPQNVYQAAKNKGDAIPHVLVKDATDKRPRLYIMRDAGLEYWAKREAENAGKPGATVGSKRTPENLKEAYLKLLQKKFYAQARLDMWTEASAKADKTVAKYLTWLTGAGLSTDEIAEVETAAKAVFATTEQNKQDERDAKAAKTKAAREAAKASPVA